MPTARKRASHGRWRGKHSDDPAGEAPSDSASARRPSISYREWPRELEPLSAAARRLVRGALDATCAALGTQDAFAAIREESGPNAGNWSMLAGGGAYEGGALPDEPWLKALAASSTPLEFSHAISRHRAADPALLTGPAPSLIGGGLEIPGRGSIAIGALASTGALEAPSVRAALAFAFGVGSEALKALASSAASDASARRKESDREAAERTFRAEFAGRIRQCWWIFDARARGAVEVSPSFGEVWGRPADAMDDGVAGFMKWVAPQDRDRALSEIHLAHGCGLSLEFRAFDPSGEIRWIWLRSFALRPLGEADLALGVSGRIGFVADDVTERKEREEATRRGEAERAHGSRMSVASELAAGVAHEINNPLTIIIGKAEQLRQAIANDRLSSAQAIESLIKIEKTAERIAAIVASLKQLARKDANLEFQTVSIARIFSEIADVAAERFKQSGVQLTMADPPTDLTVQAHPTLIGQALLNLVNNALDAASAAGRPTASRWVRVECASDDHSAYLYVTDGGAGIPIKLRGRIFDPFFTTKGPEQGTGLGLSLSASIVARHGGAIALDSFSPNTRFVIQLPLATQSAKPRPAGAA